VSGPAGTGKSRLGWEFRKYIEGLAAEVFWHRGRCLSYGEGVAFWALSEMVRQRLVWGWSLAARTAHELDDAAVSRELLALLDSHQPGHLAAMLRAERDLARARLASQDDETAPAAFASAVASLRAHGSPYHLAHGLLDHARYQLSRGDADAAAQVIGEARAIGRRLRCQPLLDRADAVERVPQRIRA